MLTVHKIFKLVSTLYSSSFRSDMSIEASIQTNLRRWHNTKYGHQFRSTKNKDNPDCLEFSVMTYNVLSQDLIHQNNHLYTHCRRSDLEWPERGLRINKELEESNTDIICLQEVHSDHFNEMYLPHMKSLGYDGFYKKRLGFKMDGCAIFYKLNRFKLMNYCVVEFNRREFSRLLDRDNVALIGVFKSVCNDAASDELIVVATTHLLFNPKRGDIKLIQLRWLLAELDRLAYRGRDDRTGCVIYHPVILCGDMNSLPDSPLHSFLRHGHLNCIGLNVGDISGQKDGKGIGKLIQEADLSVRGLNSESRFTNSPSAVNQSNSSIRPDQKTLLSHSFKFSSVYPCQNMQGETLVTTDHQKASCMVDYIFYSSSNVLKLLGYKHIMTSEQLKKMGRLPNEKEGSDHLALMAKFLLIKAHK